MRLDLPRPSSSSSSSEAATAGDRSDAAGEEGAGESSRGAERARHDLGETLCGEEAVGDCSSRKIIALEALRFELGGGDSQPLGEPPRMSRSREVRRGDGDAFRGDKWALRRERATGEALGGEDAAGDSLRGEDASGEALRGEDAPGEALSGEDAAGEAF